MTKLAHHVSAETLARATGFWRKLGAWIDDNKSAAESGRGTGLPENRLQVAGWLNEAVGSGSATMVNNWYQGKVLPEARYLVVMEKLMTAPGWYLMDPKKPWPPPPDLVAALRRHGGGPVEAWRPTGPARRALAKRRAKEGATASAKKGRLALVRRKRRGP